MLSPDQLASLLVAMPFLVLCVIWVAFGLLWEMML